MIVEWADYNKQSPTWKQYGSAMITKVAENICLKKVAGASGLVSTVEMCDERYPEDLQMVDANGV